VKVTSDDGSEAELALDSPKLLFLERP